MLSRREWLSLTLATGVAATLDRAWLSAQQPLIARAVPSTGERLFAYDSGIERANRLFLTRVQVSP